MKKNLFTIAIMIIAVGITLTSCVPSKQAFESPNTKVKDIITQSDKNSNYIKANEWMVQTFGNAQSVIQFTDKEAGVVKGKYVMKEGFISTSPYAQSTSPYFAIITIRVKDQASRIEVVPPTGMYSQKYMGIEYGFTPEMFNKDADVLLADYENYMLKKSENDNW